MWGPVITLGSYKLLRLKIENRRLGEMEALVIRSTARGSFSAVQIYPIEALVLNVPYGMRPGWEK